MSYTDDASDWPDGSVDLRNVLPCRINVFLHEARCCRGCVVKGLHLSSDLYKHNFHCFPEIMAKKLLSHPGNVAN